MDMSKQNNVSIVFTMRSLFRKFTSINAMKITFYFKPIHTLARISGQTNNPHHDQAFADPLDP